MSRKVSRASASKQNSGKLHEILSKEAHAPIQVGEKMKTENEWKITNHHI
jgi:hypothetical protein